MLKITKITNDAFQKQTLILPDGTSIQLTIKFVPMQLGWFITELTYGTFTLTGLRISNNPNMLRQWRNSLPFGLACFSNAEREPSQQQDFSSQASILYILTAAEVAQYEEFLSE